MKKKYISPEEEVVFINMKQHLLSGSPDIIHKDEEVDDFNDLEAPGMNGDVLDFISKF